MKTQVISARIDIELVRQFKEYAKSRNISTSELISKMMRLILQEKPDPISLDIKTPISTERVKGKYEDMFSSNIATFNYDL